MSSPAAAGAAVANAKAEAAQKEAALAAVRADGAQAAADAQVLAQRLQHARELQEQQQL